MNNGWNGFEAHHEDATPVLQDNCPVALSAAREAGTSAALFAPGWVYEEHDKARFEMLQERFWWQAREAACMHTSASTVHATGYGGAHLSAACLLKLAAGHFSLAGFLHYVHDTHPHTHYTPSNGVPAKP